MAFQIEPPTIEAADDPLVLCSTECPQAHGQIYDSPSGEVRRLLCRLYRSEADSSPAAFPYELLQAPRREGLCPGAHAIASGVHVSLW